MNVKALRIYLNPIVIAVGVALERSGRRPTTLIA
jgi:hypothetical protein